MKNIALVIIATGKYTRFLPKLLESSAQYFLPDHNVTPHVFTDDPKSVPFGLVHPAPRLPWPLPTLLRYQLIQVDYTEDYVFYIDADMEFVRPVEDEILGDLVATLHPGFAGRHRSCYTYCGNPASRAYVRPTEGTHYFAGGFQGGSAESYGKAMRWMKDAIAEDLRNHIIADWHDESHWNRYLMGTLPSVILSPDYCCPPGWRPETCKILALDKNHAEMRA